jgi:hypothetical protein
MPMTEEEIKNQRRKLLLEYGFIKEKSQFFGLEFELEQIAEEVRSYDESVWYKKFIWWIMRWDKPLEQKRDWLIVTLLDPLFEAVKKNDDDQWFHENIHILNIVIQYLNRSWFDYIDQINNYWLRSYFYINSTDTFEKDKKNAILDRINFQQGRIVEIKWAPEKTVAEHVEDAINNAIYIAGNIPSL